MNQIDNRAFAQNVIGIMLTCIAIGGIAGMIGVIVLVIRSIFK